MTINNRFLSVYALQAMPPSLLNRGLSGETKTNVVGGTERVRVSSQSWKAVMRKWMRERRVEGGEYGVRTRRLPALTAQALVDNHGREINAANSRSSAAYTAIGTAAADKSSTTKVVLNVNEKTPAELAAILDREWDNLAVVVDKKGNSSLVGVAAPDIEDPKAARAAAAAILKDITSELRATFDAGYAIDIALMGRMIAEIPDAEDPRAALSVGHSFSIDPAAVTFDFFTAVDDVVPEGEATSGMMGESELSAPVLYRSAVLNRHLLATNLSSAPNAADLAKQVEAGLLDAFIRSVPTGKATSTNPATLPSLVIAVESDTPVSIAEAFSAAIRTDVLATAARRAGQRTAEVAGVHGDHMKITVYPVDQALTEHVVAGLGAVQHAIVSTRAELAEAVTA